MRDRECPRCHAVSQVGLQRLVADYVDREVDGETRRVYCPHYQTSAVTPAAFEISRSMDDVFKDSFSCAYCPFRIVEPEGGLFCLYSHLDSQARNLYYIEPAPQAESHQPVHRLSISYWKCPNCHSLIEQSRREKLV